MFSFIGFRQYYCSTYSSIVTNNQFYFFPIFYWDRGVLSSFTSTMSFTWASRILFVWRIFQSSFNLLLTIFSKSILNQGLYIFIALVLTFNNDIYFFIVTMSSHLVAIHCEKYCNFTWFPGVETMRKLCLSAKFFAVIALLSIKWFGDRGSITSSSLI